MLVESGRTGEGTALWNPEHPVLRILRERRETGSKPGNRAIDDVATVGLAVEGGGMRGIVSAAMLQVIEECGLFDAFDAVYGCSSGAINAAYFLAGETWYPVSIYFQDLITKEFVDFKRVLRGESILDLDFAFGIILRERKPLEYERVLAAPIPLKTAVTDVAKLETILVSDFTDAGDLEAALRASAWLPIAVRGTGVFRGRRALDGGVLTALPFRLALGDGCTHVLSLSTRPMRPPSKRMSLVHRYTRRYLERIQPGLGHGYIAAIDEKRRDQEMLRGLRTADSEARQPYILDLAPLPGTREVKRHKLNPGLLVDAACSAAEVMYCAVEGRPTAAIGKKTVQAVPRITIVDKTEEGVRRGP
jgi:predicted patatin/cPLA2 family phospholipase